MLIKYLCAFCLGIPVFVFRDYYLSVLALEWRQWMTEQFTSEYFEDRTFYQAGALVDNPDQRISSDVRQFTDTALSVSMTILNSIIDLISFSEILYSIYPPLFVALLVYSIGGTGISIALGRKLVGLNFQQEAQEANFRYGLVRVRENAESIAFYGGEASEQRLLFDRLKAVVDNYADLLKTSRNLEFFTSFYRRDAWILPASVVAPLYFQGKIGFGVINQSSSAFNHILSDVSLIVYQFENLASFSAVIDRLGEFQEVLDQRLSSLGCLAGASSNGARLLLDVQGVTLCTPNRAATLVQDLSFQVTQGESLLIVGPSGTGKTSILRAVAGLWSTGSGKIVRPVGAGQDGDIFFIPQRPYVVLGTLRDQLLYPTWAEASGALKRVQLGQLVNRIGDGGASGATGLDAVADWSSTLSLGEQQRLAFARVLLSKPSLVLMDESTSALDTTNEELLYKELAASGTTFVSVGHRPTLKAYHQRVLSLHSAAQDGTGSAYDLLPAEELRT
eukprot:jgi/Astpho2/8156/e_gw1.00120.35.1_t